MQLTQPTNIEFTQAEQALNGVLLDYSAQLSTGKGSVIRQLIVRPYAYLYAKINQFMRDWLKSISIAQLSKSTKTQNQIADLVAGNYFVTRKRQVYAKGVITLTFNTSSAILSAGITFTVGDSVFHTQKTIAASLVPLQDTDQVQYVQMYATPDGLYRANVPVYAQEAKYLQIPVGTEVTCGVYLPNVTSIELTSPITGGAYAETDAAMLQRCKNISGTCIGTLKSISNKLQEAPINVLSCSVLGSRQEGCFRARYNNLAIPIAGAVDVYVKTSNQLSIKQLRFDSMQKTEDNKFYIQATCDTDTDIAGMLRVLSVVSQTKPDLGNYTIEYISTNLNEAVEGSRLSKTQGFKIVFQTAFQQPPPVLVSIQYMPGVFALQEFIQDDEQKILGQDYRIKAAVPVKLSLGLTLVGGGSLSQQQVQQVRTLLATVLCSKKVGDYRFSVDELSTGLLQSFPQLQLKLPHSIQVNMPMTTGGSYTFASADGTVDLSFRKTLYTWDSKAYYFYCTPSDISLKVI